MSFFAVNPLGKNFINSTKVIAGLEIRWSYAKDRNVKSVNGGELKFSLSLIIPKSDTKKLEKIRAAIRAAMGAAIRYYMERGKMTELFTYETAKQIVVLTAYCLIWGCVFYVVVNFCQLIWHRIKKSVKKIRERHNKLSKEKLRK